MITIDFAKHGGLVPVVVQHVRTRQVLMLGFMNEEAYQRTVETGRVTFFSRTRRVLWTKGETSGNYLHVRDVLVDCDSDTLLVKAAPDGPTCHTGDDTCFGESIEDGGLFLDYLSTVVADRHANPSAGSYTSRLFESGVDRVAQKVGEEGVEVVIASKNDAPERLASEAADLLFHLLVLLEMKGVPFSAVVGELRARHK